MWWTKEESRKREVFSLLAHLSWRVRMEVHGTPQAAGAM